MDQILLPTLQWREPITQTSMNSLVIELIEPSPQTSIEIIQTVNGSPIQFTKKRGSDERVPFFQFSFAGWVVRSAIDKPNFQSGTDFLESAGSIGGTVIDHQFFGQPPFENSLF
jgi:hypothetical protein